MSAAPITTGSPAVTNVCSAYNYRQSCCYQCLQFQQLWPVLLFRRCLCMYGQTGKFASGFKTNEFYYGNGPNSLSYYDRYHRFPATNVDFMLHHNYTLCRHNKVSRAVPCLLLDSPILSHIFPLNLVTNKTSGCYNHLLMYIIY